MLARELVQNLNFLQNLPTKFRVKEQVFDLNQSSVSSVCPPSWKWTRQKNAVRSRAHSATHDHGTQTRTNFG